MKSIKQLIPSAMAQKPSPEPQLINIAEWARFFKFEIVGDESEQKQLHKMVEAAARFVKAVSRGEPPFWLSFLGSCGAGKSWLAKAVVRTVRNSDWIKTDVDKDADEIRYQTNWCFWPGLAGELLSNNGYGVLKELQLDKLAALDEIGADRDPNGHVRDCLARVLSARVGMWTVLTSNKSLGEIQRDIDTRISSRMIRDNSLVVDVDVRDYALRKKPVADPAAAGVLRSNPVLKV